MISDSWRLVAGRLFLDCPSKYTLTMECCSVGNRIQLRESVSSTCYVPGTMTSAGDKGIMRDTNPAQKVLETQGERQTCDHLQGEWCDIGRRRNVYRAEKCPLCWDLLERFFSPGYRPECLEAGSGILELRLRAKFCSLLVFVKALYFSLLNGWKKSIEE